jgi:hypothetical protein
MLNQAKNCPWWGMQEKSIVVGLIVFKFHIQQRKRQQHGREKKIRVESWGLNSKLLGWKITPINLPCVTQWRRLELAENYGIEIRQERGGWGSWKPLYHPNNQECILIYTQFDLFFQDHHQTE